MDQSRREYRARRAGGGDRPGRHRAAAGASLRTRRVVAAVLAGLAVGSAAIGAARGQESSVRVAGDLVGDVRTVSGAPTSASPASTPTATPSPSAGGTSPVATRSSATSTATSSPSTSGASGAGPSTRATATVPERGSGRLTPVRVPGADSTGPGRVVTYALDVEEGAGVARDEAARIVGTTLRDPRGWQRVDGVRFVQITPAARAKGASADVTVTLASPATTDRLCAPLRTERTWSCANKDRAVINAKRWVQATPTYATKPLRDYRSYVVNHEVGHELGHGHVGCPGQGRPAAVMAQQSMGLDGCRPNVWPSVTRG